ncbi:uncharacterized protein BKCO1_4900076 [Diplodia corticola]|uniref:Uncharacterized protein n=1 Tax=Diplodia corticola TaxID=236234 RepID=A0A1J9QSF3_9PEZI|nr:uncharacterized protein BKCO1_4900076 [Diplodia corticola]OJD31384.1 hypothetical protein BKCO1_4900076 [Diplodia corticola]
MSAFPIIFNIDGSSRHEVLLVSPSVSLADLSAKIESTATSSPNCQEFMAKYAKKKGDQKVEAIKVRWAMAGRDHKTFPSTTALTDDNTEAVLHLIERSGVGKDVLEVKLAAEAEEKA